MKPLGSDVEATDISYVDYLKCSCLEYFWLDSRLMNSNDHDEQVDVQPLPVFKFDEAHTFSVVFFASSA